MGMQAPQQPRLGGLVGLISAIPGFIEQMKQQKMLDQIQRTIASNQELDIYRQQAIADPKVAQDPAWVAAVTKIAKGGGITLPFQQGPAGTITPVPGGAAPAGGAVQPVDDESLRMGAGQPRRMTTAQPNQMAAPATSATSTQPVSGQQTLGPRGPQLDLAAFTGVKPGADFAEAVQKNMASIQEADPAKRGAIVEATIGRPLTPDEAKTLANLPQQLPPAQQEAERKAIDTVVGKQLAQAAQTGTAAALTAAVRFNYSRMERAGYTDDEINALLDPSLDQLTPAELNKIAAGKATNGLKDAQASYLRQSAQARIDKINADIEVDRGRAAELKAQGQSVLALIGPKSASLRAQAAAAYARASTAASTNARNNAEAKFYTERATDLKQTGNPRATATALTSIRAAKASTDANIRSIQSDITRIQTSLTSTSPQAKTQNDAVIKSLRDQMAALQDRSNQYDQAITTLANKIAPGTNLPSPSARTSDGSEGTAPAGSVRVTNPTTGQFGWRWPDGTIHPDAAPAPSATPAQ